MRRTRPGGGRGCRVAAGILGRVAAVGLVAGCGNGSFAPPPPPELSALPAAGTTAVLTTVELVVNPGRDPERDVWVQAARVEAGFLKALFLVNAPPADAPPGWRAGQVRSAKERGVQVLMVEGGDDPDLAAALAEARSAGLRVVVVGRPLPGKAPAPPFHRAGFADADGPARQLVRVALAAARAGGAPAAGHALIVSSPDAGPLSHALGDAIERALKAGGDRRVSRLDLPADERAADRATLDRVEADPALALAFGVDTLALQSLTRAHDAVKARRDFVTAGALRISSGANAAALLPRYAAVIDLRFGALGRAALKAAVLLGRGEPVDPVVTVPLDVHDWSSARGAPRVL